MVIDNFGNKSFMFTMRSTTTKHGFSNGSSSIIGLFILMDMSILIKGPKHVFFDESS
jgi:hypothetical protein